MAGWQMPGPLLALALCVAAAGATRNQYHLPLWRTPLQLNSAPTRSEASEKLLEHQNPQVREAALTLKAAAKALVDAEGGHQSDEEGQISSTLTTAEKLISKLKVGVGGAAGVAANRGPRYMRRESLAEQQEVGATSSGSSTGWHPLDPEAADMASVSAWVKNISAFVGKDPAPSLKELRTDPGGAVQLLMGLAEQARSKSDGVDRDQQAFYHLLELHLEARRAGSGMELAPALVASLAQDYHNFYDHQHAKPTQAQLAQVAESGKSSAVAALSDVFASFYRGRTVKDHEKSHSSKRALVFSCSFGDGHRSAAQAVKNYLQQADFDVRIVDTTSDPTLRAPIAQLLGIDPLRLYNNIILKHHMYRLHNLYDQLRSLAFGQLTEACPAPTCNTVQKNSLREYVLESRPSLIVTVYHMDLLPILEVAKDLGNLPVLHVATDMDAKMSEVFGSEGPAATYPRFLAAVPFENPMSMETLKPLALKQSFVSGYPVREAFLTESQAQVPMPSGKKVVLVMSGGGGQSLPWLEELASDARGLKLHLVVLVGRNAAEGRRLRASLPALNATVAGSDWAKGRHILQCADKNVTLEVAEDPAFVQTKQPYYVGAKMLVKLMDSADAIITKPGGGTTAELAYRGLPALFDASAGLLHWEDFTVQVFESLSRGQRFSSLASLQEGLGKVLALGRSTSLAADSQRPGHLLNTKQNLIHAAEGLMAKECNRCSVFS